ncbi:MAG: PIN domain nuclease [Oscillospiraceae bacterium]|nr:PIN domain nuclease [Oscillospiraceae bacterium]
MADDAPEKRDDTRVLWEQLAQGDYEVVISPVVYEELDRCDDGLREQLYSCLDTLERTFNEENEETILLAKEYLKTGILREESYNDCRHIAIASIYGCKYILSWNMKHFVKRRTIEMVQEVNRRLGVFQPSILTPTIFIEEGDDND